MVSRTTTHILDYLERRPSASADEISQVLSMTKENIQYHLKKMLQEGTIKRTTLSGGKESRRGRPTYLYRLSEQSSQGNIPGLADKLLELVLATTPPRPSQADFLAQLAAAMFPFQPAANQSQNLRQTIQRLNKQQYQAAWEAHASGPYVYFRNCPYASILKEHPELCLLDGDILACMLKSCVSQITKMNLDDRKPPVCTFLIQSG